MLNRRDEGVQEIKSVSSVLKQRGPCTRRVGAGNWSTGRELKFNLDEAVKTKEFAPVLHNEEDHWAMSCVPVALRKRETHMAVQESEDLSLKSCACCLRVPVQGNAT